jgi:hypothetical protein
VCKSGYAAQILLVSVSSPGKRLAIWSRRSQTTLLAYKNCFSPFWLPLVRPGEEPDGGESTSSATIGTLNSEQVLMITGPYLNGKQRTGANGGGPPGGKQALQEIPRRGRTERRYLDLLLVALSPASEKRKPHSAPPGIRMNSRERGCWQRAPTPSVMHEDHTSRNVAATAWWGARA